MDCANTASEKAESNINPNEPYLERIVREPERLLLTGVKRGTWYNLVKEGKAPGGTQLSTNTIGYRLSDIQNWIDERFNNPQA